MYSPSCQPHQVMWPDLFGYYCVNITSLTPKYHLPVYRRSSEEETCKWGTYSDVKPDGTPYCAFILDAFPGWRALWQSIGWITTFLQVLMFVWTLHDIYRLHLARRQGLVKRFFTNPLFHGQLVSAIGSILMAVAYIDGWGLQTWYSPRDYLGMYAPAYGLIGAHSCIIAIYIFDVLIWKVLRPDIRGGTGLVIGSWIGIGLVVAYAAIGYPAFGWVLAGEFEDNPSTKLGPIGNYLAYTMYGLIMLVSLVAGVGSYITLTIHEDTRREDCNREKAILTKGRIMKWCTVNFMACAIFLGFAMNYQWRAKDENPTFTFYLLGANRFLELVLQSNTNSFSDSQYVEGSYLYHFFTKNRVRERGETSVTRMSRVGSTLHASTAPKNKTNTNSTDATDSGRSPRHSRKDSNV